MKNRVTAVFLLLGLLVLMTLLWAPRVGEGYNNVAVFLPPAAHASETSTTKVLPVLSTEFTDISSNSLVSADWVESLGVQPQTIPALQPSSESQYAGNLGNWTVTQNGEFIEFLGLRAADAYTSTGGYVCGSSLDAKDMWCTGGGCPSFACSQAGYTAIKCSGEWTCTQVPGSCLFTQSAYVYQKVWGTCEYRSDLVDFGEGD